MRVLTRILVLALVLGTAIIPNSLASAWRTQHGSIIQLHGTPHLWLADEQGIYHWVGDTRALSGKHALWDSKRFVSIHELVTFPVGDPNFFTFNPSQTWNSSASTVATTGNSY